MSAITIETWESKKIAQKPWRGQEVISHAIWRKLGKFLDWKVISSVLGKYREKVKSVSLKRGTKIPSISTKCITLRLPWFLIYCIRKWCLQSAEMALKETVFEVSKLSLRYQLIPTKFRRGSEFNVLLYAAQQNKYNIPPGTFWEKNRCFQLLELQ